MRRYQKQQIIRDLGKKIVFLVGPRQVGKTWLALDIAKSFKNSLYLNYDNLKDRKIINDEAWLDDVELLILDELHKMPQWKNYLKGIYDTKAKNMQILVTGSARLNAFREAGDSLAGRFYVQRLLPFSPFELHDTKYADDLDRFIDRGGFPEPFLTESSVEADRWRMQYVDSLIRTDILDFEKIHDFKAIQLVLKLLQQRVGSPISLSSIAQDVGIAPNTVKKYIHILEALFIVFRVAPFSHNIARSLLKEPKIYFFDTGMVKGDDGEKFENLMALSLLKYTYLKQDYLAKDIHLHYLRTKEQKEVDFCLIENKQIIQIIESKLSNPNLDKSLVYFSEKYNLPAVQVVKNLKRERKNGDISVISGLRFLHDLN